MKDSRLSIICGKFWPRLRKAKGDKSSSPSLNLLTHGIFQLPDELLLLVAFAFGKNDQYNLALAHRRFSALGGLLSLQPDVCSCERPSPDLEAFRSVR